MLMTLLKKERLCINSLNLISYPLEDCIVAITQEKYNQKINNSNNRRDADIEIKRAKNYIKLVGNNKVINSPFGRPTRLGFRDTPSSTYPEVYYSDSFPCGRPIPKGIGSSPIR